MPVNSTSPMSTSLPPASPVDSGSRKRIVLAGAGVLALVMVFAFFTGGHKAPPPLASAEEDEPFEGSDWGKDYKLDQSEMQEWFNVPQAPVPTGQDGQPPAVADLAAKSASVVTGDSEAVPASPPVPIPQPEAMLHENQTAVASTPPAVPATASIGAAPPVATVGAPGTVGASGPNAAMPDIVPQPTPEAVAPASTIAASQTASAPPSSSSPSAASPLPPADPQPPSAPAAPRIADAAQASIGAASPAAHTPVPAAPAREEAPAITASRPPASPSSPPAVASADLPPQAPAGLSSKTPGDTPEFVPPATRRPGVVAQSRSLITEQQFAETALPPGAPATSSPPASSGALPVRVSKKAATAFAEKTTEKLQEQGRLKPTQRIRLPRQAETANTRIWREEDTPAAADELRPFGVVIEETNPATTAEGIPLRTDIPAGVSPLEKTGADKPLWKRPGM